MLRLNVIFYLHCFIVNYVEVITIPIIFTYQFIDYFDLQQIIITKR